MVIYLVLHHRWRHFALVLEFALAHVLEFALALVLEFALALVLEFALALALAPAKLPKD